MPKIELKREHGGAPSSTDAAEGAVRSPLRKAHRVEKDGAPETDEMEASVPHSTDSAKLRT